MSKKKGSAKGKKSRAPKRASMPPSSAPISSAASSASAPLREPKEKLDQKIEKLHEKLQEKHEAARAGFASDPAIDDTSIPPVVEDEFFAKGEEPHRISHAGASGAFEPIHQDSRGSHRKHTPEAHARRGELAKYVKAAVAVSAAILVIGFVKIKFFDKPPAASQPVAANITAVTPPVDTVPAPTQITPPAPAPAPQATETAPVEKTEPVAAADAGKVDDTTAKAEDKTEDKPKPTRTAAQEKAAAQAALEGGNAGGAIAAGQRSVALDPTDAEAWLILGGAYQMQSRNGEAKAAFSSCAKQAKRGPVSECTQMLSQ